jgi:hypothetical protein
MKNKNSNYAMKNMQRKYFYEFLCKSWLFGSNVEFLGQQLTFVNFF